MSFQSGSFLDASIFTCHSPPYYTELDESTLESDATHDTNLPGASQATSAGIPSIPTHSTQPSATLESATSEPPSGTPEPLSADPLSSSESLPWVDMGPHDRGNTTGTLFAEIGSFQPVMRLKNAQWLLRHLVGKHESAAHRLLAVSFYNNH